MLQAAARVADGQLPYRDFYANYGPGQYYLLGALDWLLGPSLLAWRVLRVLVDAAIAVLAYALVRRDAPEPLALAAWLAVAATMAFPSLPHPNPSALALAFGGLVLARRAPAAAGALAGLAFCFRFDIGVAAAAGVMLAASEGGRRAVARAAGAAGLVAGLLVLPFVLAAPSDFWDQTFGFALDQQSLQRLPLAGDYEGGFEPEQASSALLRLPAAGRVRPLAGGGAARAPPVRLWAPVPLAAAGIAYLLARADEFHFVPLAAVLPVLLATAAASERRAGRSAWALCLMMVLGLIALYGLDRKRIELLDPPALATVDVDAADGVKARAGEARALSELVRYVRARTPPGEPIYVANPRFDLVRAGNPLVYVLAGRDNPTRYDVMQPGVVTTAVVQREIIGDLERAQPELIVRWLSPVADEAEPNGAGRSSGVRLLDRYIAGRYDQVERFGDYAVLRRDG